MQLSWELCGIMSILSRSKKCRDGKLHTCDAKIREKCIFLPQISPIVWLIDTMLVVLHTNIFLAIEIASRI